MYSANLSPQQRKKYEVKYTELGCFELREQTAQVCFFLADSLRRIL
jgi:hypothetical protein